MYWNGLSRQLIQRPKPKDFSIWYRTTLSAYVLYIYPVCLGSGFVCSDSKEGLDGCETKVRRRYVDGNSDINIL